MCCCRRSVQRAAVGVAEPRVAGVVERAGGQRGGARRRQGLGRRPARLRPRAHRVRPLRTPRQTGAVPHRRPDRRRLRQRHPHRIGKNYEFFILSIFDLAAIRFGGQIWI